MLKNPLKWVCQYPVTGEIHFYNLMSHNNKIIKLLCQYPVTGEIHFYSPIYTPA